MAKSKMPTEPLPRVCSAAERMRRHRERRREGFRCMTIELHITEIDGLVRRGFLKAETRNDQSAVLDALYAFLERALRTEEHPKPQGVKGTSHVATVRHPGIFPK
jgi:hypothetical protein